MFLFEKFIELNNPTRVSARVSLIQVFENGGVSVFPVVLYLTLKELYETVSEISRFGCRLGRSIAG